MGAENNKVSKKSTLEKTQPETLFGIRAPSAPGYYIILHTFSGHHGNFHQNSECQVEATSATEHQSELREHQRAEERVRC